MIRISVVIPTLNERANIVPLLQDLRRQSLPPAEVIVVDGQSEDGTPELAARVPGVRVVRSERGVGRQRQIGLQEAAGELVAFFDADVHVPERFLERAVEEMRRRRLRAACPLYWPRPSSVPVKAVFAFFNGLFLLLQKVLPSGAGMGILVERDLALKSGGFDAECRYDDIEFIRRMGRRARFGIVKLPLFVSDRRFRTEGVGALFGKYLLLSAFFTLGLFRLANRVGYRFGHHRQRDLERVVLVDGQDRPIGTALKSRVHTEDTPLHRAFSVFVFDSEGRLLLQLRALSKKTWPGVWSNSCCGHPAPGEAYEAAVRRRLYEELGISEADVRPGLPDFRYEARWGGLMEREICPVFLAYTSQAPIPDPAEVEEVQWAPWDAFLKRVEEQPESLSPWCVMEATLLSQEFGSEITKPLNELLAQK